MAKKSGRKMQKTDQQKLLETMQDLLITQLGRSGVPQTEIRKIVGIDIVRVNTIVKHIKK